MRLAVQEKTTENEWNQNEKLKNCQRERKKERTNQRKKERNNERKKERKKDILVELSQFQLPNT